MTKKLFLQITRFNKFLITISFFCLPFFGNSFGVLTHEAIIDAAWEKSILPLLKSKYPASTEEALKDAHAYAYGGAVAPDMGFYPFGSKLFTNLVHYVRSGDMVNALLKNANNLNEYAFALGFLSHYNADNHGHPLATNRSVPLVYPKLQKKFGNKITYAQDKISHMRMEFGFDVLQVTKGNYASLEYQGFIGFKVDTSILARAFMETYGLDINKVFGNHLSLTVEVFRYTVANIFPLITKSAWATKSLNIVNTDSTASAKHFRFKMRQKQYNKQYGTGYKRPGIFPVFLSLFIRVLPKVGPLRVLKFKIPNAASEKYFIQSFDTIIQKYTSQIEQLQQSNIHLKDINYDTGESTQSCEYSLADDTYRKWILALKKNEFKDVTNPIKQNILVFYNGISIKSNQKSSKCDELYRVLNELKTIP